MMSKRFDILPRLPVGVNRATGKGTLAPIFMGEDLMLEAPGAEAGEFPFGANVDSLLIFDMDAGHIVERIEILVPRPRWVTTDDVFPAAPRVKRAALTITGSAPEVYVEDLTPSFRFNPSSGQLAIEIEPWSMTATHVPLSKRCRAVLNDDFLAGLVVELQPPISSPL